MKEISQNERETTLKGTLDEIYFKLMDELSQREKESNSRK